MSIDGVTRPGILPLLWLMGKVLWGPRLRADWSMQIKTVGFW